jgi:hypothetical protein
VKLGVNEAVGFIVMVFVNGLARGPGQRIGAGIVGIVLPLVQIQKRPAAQPQEGEQQHE